MRSNDLLLLLTITNRTYGEEFAALFESYRVPIVITALGRGTANQKILDCFGLVRSDKAVMFSVARRATADVVMRELINTMHIGLPGNGIALTVPISSIGGRTLLRCIQQERDEMTGKEQREENMERTSLELLAVIVNEGHTDTVMEAAHTVNVWGGTVIHAKGSGMGDAEKFFGMSIAEEKELVFIVTRASQKNELMKAIMAKAGMQTEAQAMVLSLPVDGAVGLPPALTE